MKRTVRRFGKPLGHRKGMHGTELLGYETNADMENPSKPLSHASLVKAYVEGRYPMTEQP